MTQHKSALIVFARNPVSGKVKTRLAEITGKEKALEIYKILLENIYINIKDLNYGKFLFLSDYFDENLFDPGFTQVIQKGSDLGEKMYGAIDSVLKAGFEKVIIIGTDIPGIDYKIISEAFNELSYCDVVIGPARDGGYYLIGMKEPDVSLFENMEWGSDRVLSETIIRINKKDGSFYLLKELNDIDTYEDLKYFNL